MHYHSPSPIKTIKQNNKIFYQVQIKDQDPLQPLKQFTKQYLCHESLKYLKMRQMNL